MVLPLVGISIGPTNGRTTLVFSATTRYTRHEVTAPRAVGFSAASKSQGQIGY